jgi:hypothetical protein
MKPLNLFDALGVPLYDAFGASPANSEPYTAIAPKINLAERNGANAPAAAQSQGLNLTIPDQVPQDVLDSILWQSVHGAGAVPPPPGPNATPEAKDADG